MIFPYQVLISEAPDGGDYILISRPEVPVIIAGPSGADTFLGLVDTGSDHTILPKSIADELGIPLRPAAGPPASVFGGFPVRLMIGDVTLALKTDQESCRWTTTIQFFEFATTEDEMVILGHSGFLDYFTATFDGKLGLLSLEPNDELPPAS